MSTSIETRRPRVNYIYIGLWIALLITCAIWAAPIVFVIFTALKSNQEIFSSPAFALPTAPMWENFTAAIEQGNLLTVGGNSLLIALIKVPVGLFISALCAFAIARLRFRFSKVVLAFIALGAMVPIQVAIGPLFRVVVDLGLLNTYIGVILPYIAFGLPYQTFILYGFFRQIPVELDESAKLDGVGTFRLFWQIILPLSKPALAALFVLDFVATWNEYSIALVLLQDSNMWTVPLAIQGFQTQFTASYGPINAFTLLSMLPVLIVFLMFQRFFVQGAFAGAVKG